MLLDQRLYLKSSSGADFETSREVIGLGLVEGDLFRSWLKVDWPANQRLVVAISV